jgi:hypothetical protein
MDTSQLTLNLMSMKIYVMSGSNKHMINTFNLVFEITTLEPLDSMSHDTSLHEPLHSNNTAC